MNETTTWIVTGSLKTGIITSFEHLSTTTNLYQINSTGLNQIGIGIIINNGHWQKEYAKVLKCLNRWTEINSK